VKVSTLKVLICDDHELIREGLKRILIDGGLASRVGEASNASEAISAMRLEQWDIAIVDIRLGGRNGIELLVEVKNEFPKLPVLILSTYSEEQFALRAIRSGARGYLNKNMGSHALIAAIQKIMAGSHHISDKVAEQLANASRRHSDQPPHSDLSNREDQVLRLIGAGRTVSEIAILLILSVKTVSTYRAALLRKLGLENNAQLMRYALENGMEE
jgi:DNA-binding NarL/FixJ family response regulator